MVVAICHLLEPLALIFLTYSFLSSSEVLLTLESRNASGLLLTDKRFKHSAKASEYAYHVGVCVISRLELHLDGHLLARVPDPVNSKSH